MKRVLFATVVALAALAAAPAVHAQGRGPNLKYEPPVEDKPVFDERKYRAASESIPEAQRTNDPWAGAREATPAATQAPAAKPRGKQATQR